MSWWGKNFCLFQYSSLITDCTFVLDWVHVNLKRCAVGHILVTISIRFRKRKLGSEQEIIQRGTRTEPRQTKPRQTKSRHGQNLDRDRISTQTKSRHRQYLDKTKSRQDKTPTDKISTWTKCRHGHLLNKNLDNFFFQFLILYYIHVFLICIIQYLCINVWYICIKHMYIIYKYI